MNNLNRSGTSAALLCAVALLPASVCSALAEVHYVDLNSASPTPPYTNCTTAATNIQDAVEAAVAGDEIVVTNGTYATGGSPGNRVAVDKPLILRSVNGPQFTIIDGGQSVRCVYLTNGVSLSGFTLTNGNTFEFSGGAGVFCESQTTVVSNCVVSGNVADADLNHTHGGGVSGGTLNNCTLSGNVAEFGGGASGCKLSNCTLTSNRAAYGGGAYGCTLNNCILFSNIDRGGCEDCGSPGSMLGNNWSGDPLFVDQPSGNLRLQPNSPCINAGNNSYAMGSSDLDGNSRIAGGTVDMGAYEFQSPASMISYAWLRQFNLPINASTDTADPDGDGVNNYREWLAGTDPTNPFSSPAQLTIIPSGINVILTWSTNAVGFTLQSTTNLSSPAVTSSPAPVVIGGLNAVTNPISGPQQFFRLSLSKQRVGLMDEWIAGLVEENSSYRTAR